LLVETVRTPNQGSVAVLTTLAYPAGTGVSAAPIVMTVVAGLPLARLGLRGVRKDFAERCVAPDEELRRSLDRHFDTAESALEVPGWTEVPCFRCPATGIAPERRSVASRSAVHEARCELHLNLSVGVGSIRMPVQFPAFAGSGWHRRFVIVSERHNLVAQPARFGYAGLADTRLAVQPLFGPVAVDSEFPS